MTVLTSTLGGAQNSTIVRSSDRAPAPAPTPARPFQLPLSLRLQRLGMRALGRLAPSLAGRAAGRLFVTPPRFPVPAREQALLEEATRFVVPWRGLRLSAWALEPTRAGADPGTISASDGGPRTRGTALLVHGWGGRGAQLGALTGPLRAAGYRVVFFDHPAHGASEGKTATLLDMADAVRAVAEVAGRIDILVAHSLGGAAAGFAMADGLAVGRAAILASPSFPREATRRFAAFLSLPARAEAALEAEVERRVGALYRDVEVPGRVASVRTPVLVVHDTDDDEIPAEEGRALASALPEGRFLATSGLGHRRILRDEGVIARVTAFLLGQA